MSFAKWWPFLFQTTMYQITYLHLRTYLMGAMSQPAPWSATQYWSISAWKQIYINIYKYPIKNLHLDFFTKGASNPIMCTQPHINGTCVTRCRNTWKDCFCIEWNLGVLTSDMDEPHIKLMIKSLNLSSSEPAEKRRDKLHSEHLNSLAPGRSE